MKRFINTGNNSNIKSKGVITNKLVSVGFLAGLVIIWEIIKAKKKLQKKNSLISK